MRKQSIIICFCLFLLSTQSRAQQTAFKSGEKIFYTIFYNVIGLYVNAGNASFTTIKKKYNDNEVYHAVGEGASNSNYDWIFKVRDRYESIFHSTDITPLKFIRDINEGKHQKYQEVVFDPKANIARTDKGVFKVPDQVHDVISILYYARNIDYTRYEKGDKIPFNMFLGTKVYNMYIRYEGKETIKTKYGKFKVLKLKPLLLQGRMFKGGEKMDIWITDDRNHVPVRIESPISVGKIKVDLMNYQNLKHPLSSLLQKN
jgi:hypothetical protein